MALTIPDWKEKNPADIGIMLVELLAYAGDYLSYRQDAIATEAYLGTARKRISVKRHARLVDYNMHDGCNARTWIHLEVTEGVSGVTLPGNQNGNAIKFATTVPGQATVIKANTSQADEFFSKAGFEVFEPMHDLVLDSRFNKLSFYTWGKTTCHLSEEETTTTIDGHIDDLVGKILVIQEVASPHTFSAADADRLKRHAVRIIKAEHGHDILVGNSEAPEDPAGRPITKITWHDEDALPFSFCINTLTPEGEVVTTANLLGNIVLADHGHSIEEHITFTKQKKSPLLQSVPLSYASVYQDQPTMPASKAIINQPDRARPSIVLRDVETPTVLWEPVGDLISSQFNQRHFVVEMENDGQTRI
ncbi:MAG: putative baseplate assembly protein, partial [Pedobacter sp.]